jgi:hypothetical protein
VSPWYRRKECRSPKRVGTIDLGALGKAKINTELEVEVDVDISTSEASIEMESSFVFAGQPIDIARFKLEAKTDTFKQLPTIISKKVEDALNDVFKDATKWVNAVGSGVVDGVADTQKVLTGVYKKSAKEAADLANSAGKGVNQATKAVENTAKDVSKTAKKTIKKAKFW